MSYLSIAELPMGSDDNTAFVMRKSLSITETLRPCRRLLMTLRPRDSKWGFTIYRTVYTPESDALFVSALEKIKACFVASLRYELRHNTVGRLHDLTDGEPIRPLMHAGPCEQAEDQYQPLVIEDREMWDGASIEDVRAHFRDAIFLKALRLGHLSYGPEKEHTTPSTPLARDPQSSICLVLDAEALGWMANGRLPDIEIYGLSEEELRALPTKPFPYLNTWPLRNGEHGRVKGVDADWPRHVDIWSQDRNESSMLGARNRIPDPPRAVSQYQGWKPVRCEELWDLYDDLSDGGRLGR